MTLSDPIADMLNRIRNALMAGHDSVLVPSSKLKLSLAKILKAEGFINDCDVVKDKSFKVIKINLKYLDRNQPAIAGMERISKPGLRVYAQRKEIPRVYGGSGIAILSTAKGMMTGQKAWKQGIGGEILCYVW